MKRGKISKYRFSATEAGLENSQLAVVLILRPLRNKIHEPKNF